MDRKKVQELWFGRRLAQEINEREQADYEAEPNDRIDAAEDLFLVSRSGRPLRRSFQVVTVPIEMEAREETDHIRNLKTQLTSALQTRGFDHCWVSVAVSQEGLRRGVTDSLVNSLANLIFERGRTSNAILEDRDVCRYDQALSKRVIGVSVSHLEGLTGVQVAINQSSFVPLDGRWIEEGIELKKKKYGSASKEMGLAIGALVFVDMGQIEAFRRGSPPESLPFREVWIVSVIHGVVPIKSPEGGSGV